MRIITDSKDSFLSTVCEDFDFSNPIFDPEQTANEMYLLMLKSNGLGLAAPQIGLSINLFVLGDDDKRRFIFNPKIISQSSVKVTESEGCLSFPLLFLNVARPDRISASYQNEKGDEKIESFDATWARCFVHELDHLNGIVFTKHVSRLVLDQGKRKQTKRRKEISNRG